MADYIRAYLVTRVKNLCICHWKKISDVKYKINGIKFNFRFFFSECNMQTDRKLFHLRSLIEGAIYRELESDDLAGQCFEEAIARQNGMKDDKHVAAFATYDLGTIHMQKPEVRKPIS
jgi:hypothetical protein